jgi:RNA polymerase sigma-70 factor (ECF subfamily)
MDAFLASEQDFSRLYRDNVRGLLAFLTRRTCDAQVALDLTAETFAQAFASRRTFRGTTDGEAAGWLFAIARRQLAHYFRSGEVSRKLTDRLAGGPVIATDADLDRIEELASLSEVRVTLRQHLQTMDPVQRQVLWLRIVEEQPYEAVTSRLGIGEQAARKRVSRALRSLTEALAIPDAPAKGAYDGP